MESIFEGTWASGPPPDEFVTARLMDVAGWSWQEFEATPSYVRRLTWDYYQAKASAEQAEQDRQRSETEARRHGARA